MRQLVLNLPLRNAQGREAFFVSPANADTRNVVPGPERLIRTRPRTAPMARQSWRCPAVVTREGGTCQPV